MASLLVLDSPKARQIPDALQGAFWGGLAVGIWGIYLAFARSSVTTGVLPEDIAFVRFATAALIMLPWLLRQSPTALSSLTWPRASILALLAGPLFILVGASGFRFAPLSHGAVVQPAMLTVAGIALGVLLLGDRFRRSQFVGVAAILAGLILVAGPGTGEQGIAALRGDLLFALAGAMWAGFAVLSRRWAVSPMAATATVAVLSIMVYAPIYATTRGFSALLAQSPATLLQQIVVQGVLSGVVAVFAFGRAVELLGSSRASALPALVPVIATLVGIPVTGEFPTLLQTAGLAVVTVGLITNQTRFS